MEMPVKAIIIMMSCNIDPECDSNIETGGDKVDMSDESRNSKYPYWIDQLKKLINKTAPM